jgi:hypothetical protein
MKFKENLLLQIFIIYIRYLIGGAFVFASIVKIQGKRFTSESGELSPINSAWHFFETMYQSGLYWKFIGIGQLVAGGLLMTQKYAKLGAVLNFPIVANVFIVTISYEFGGTPLITGLMLLANTLLIIWHSNELKILINLPPLLDSVNSFEKDITWQIAGLLMFVFTIVLRGVFDSYNIFIWGGVCVLIGLIGFVIGIYRKKKFYCNTPVNSTNFYKIDNQPFYK